MGTIDLPSRSLLGLHLHRVQHPVRLVQELVKVLTPTSASARCRPVLKKYIYIIFDVYHAEALALGSSRHEEDEEED